MFDARDVQKYEGKLQEAPIKAFVNLFQMWTNMFGLKELKNMWNCQDLCKLANANLSANLHIYLIRNSTIVCLLLGAYYSTHNQT